MNNKTIPPDIVKRKITGNWILCKKIHTKKLMIMAIGILNRKKCLHASESSKCRRLIRKESKNSKTVKKLRRLAKEAEKELKNVSQPLIK